MINKDRLNGFLLIIISVIFTFFLCEIILRIKHSIIPNYDIEMWKYAKELKVSVSDKSIGHVHRPNKSGIFQKVEIFLPEWSTKNSTLLSIKYLENEDMSYHK